MFTFNLLHSGMFKAKVCNFELLSFLNILQLTYVSLVNLQKDQM